MDLKKLIAKLKKIEGTEEIVTALETHAEEHEKLRTDSSALEAINETLGDRDLGELIGFAEAAKAAEVDTAEKIVELKNKANGSEQTISELKTEAEKLQTVINESKADVEAKTTKATEKLLAADVKVALSDQVGNKALFDLALKAEAAKFTRDDKGAILYDGKSVEDAVEKLRDIYGPAFKAPPSGTGNPGGDGNGQQPPKDKIVSMRDNLKRQINK